MDESTKIHSYNTHFHLHFRFHSRPFKQRFISMYFNPNSHVYISVDLLFIHLPSKLSCQSEESAEEPHLGTMFFTCETTMKSLRCLV